MDDFKRFIYCIAAAVGLTITIALLIALAQYLTLIGWIFLGCIMAIGAAATLKYLVLPILHSGTDLLVKFVNMWADTRIKLSQHEIDKYITSSRVPLDDNGNPPALIDIDPHRVLMLPPGQYKEYPHLTSLHMHNAAPKLIEEKKPEESEPREVISGLIRYEDIAREVPDELSLLGIHPMNGNLEIVPPDRYKTTWFVGGSNTGKTNTVYGKVADAVRWGAGLIICDPHANKPDSLTNKLKDFHYALLLPIAQSDRDIYNALLTFLQEFETRRDLGKPCTQKWLIVVDEVNGLARHTFKVDGKEVKMQTYLQELAETCGYEARGFEMFGYFISQKVAGLSWLRNAMMTLFVHGLLMESEALLAANNDRKLARQVMGFKKGRTLVYGYEFDPLILHQPLYSKPKDEHPANFPMGTDEAPSLTYPLPDLPMKNGWEGNGKGTGRAFLEENPQNIFELKKMLSEIKKMSDAGMSNDAILKHFGLTPGGRNNQNLKAVLAVLADLENGESEE